MVLDLHAKQGQAFLSEGTELLFGGGAGGGKSHLMRAALISWSYDIPGLQSYLFRRTLDDLLMNHMDGPTGFPIMLAEWIEKKWCKINYSKNFIAFWNGSKIHLCHCQYEKHVYKYQGPEIHVLAIDELTHWIKKMYRFLRSRVRIGGLEIPEKYKGMFPRILLSSNPGNIGHNWVKKDFVDLGPYNLMKMPPREGGMKRIFIPSLAIDNPTLTENDPTYMDKLEGLGNPELVKAMKSGDWNIVSGGMFDDKWCEEIHTIDDFAIPARWTVFRAFDWGSSKPFSVGWYAIADGTDVAMPDGNYRSFIKGTYFRIAEWYGCVNGESNEGLKLTAREIAQGIMERQESWNILKNRHIMSGPADSSIYAKDRGEAQNSIGEDMEDEGVFWERSDKSPGSRVNGWEIIRGRLDAALKSPQEDEALYFFKSCKDAIALLPIMPRDENNTDDLDTKSEDHIADELRYACLHQFATGTQAKLKGAS